MNAKTIIDFIFLSALFLFVIACSNDNEDPEFPSGTVSLNMLNEDSGRTELGNSDVYIDSTYNFHGISCSLASIGKQNGLTNMPDPQIQNLNPRVAVEQGCAYQIFSDASLREFPSGKLALNIKANYYNVYVDTPIKQGETYVGAVVKFILLDVPSYGLPDFGTDIGTLDHLDGNKKEIVLELPTSDFEYEPEFNNFFNKFEHTKSSNKLIVKLIEYEDFPQSIGFYIRIKNSYTYVTGNVQ